MRLAPPPGPPIVRAVSTLALIAALALLGSAWIAVTGSADAGREGSTGAPAAPDALAGRADPAAAAGGEAVTTDADPDAPAVWPDSHVVVAGDSLSGIADRYGLDTDVLMEANALVDAPVLQPGDVLHLPDPERPRPRSAQSAATDAPELAKLLAQTARAFDLPPATVQAVAWVESRWDHGQVSERGAIGVMQVRPETAKVMARVLDRPLDPHVLEDNVLAGVGYLDRMLGRYDGDLRSALAAYVQGPTRLDAEGVTPTAAAYVERVLRAREVFAAAGAAAE
jgi:soluble lytic murein transglycosylase-like protein